MYPQPTKHEMGRDQASGIGDRGSAPALWVPHHCEVFVFLARWEDHKTPSAFLTAPLKPGAPCMTASALSRHFFAPPAAKRAWGSVCLGRTVSRACSLRRSEEHTSELQSLRHLVCR